MTQSSSYRPLLAIDTSTRTVGLALYDGHQVLQETVWTSYEFHTVQLAPTVDDALRKTGLSPDSLGAVSVAIGPGSFTGLRVGMALAKGFALAGHLPLIGVRTLDVLAAAQPILDIPLVAILQAGRGRYAIGWYHADKDSWEPVSEIELLSAMGLAELIQSPTLLCGELQESDRQVIEELCQDAILSSPAQSIRRPGFLAEIAWYRWQEGQIDDPATLTPVYLHYSKKTPE